MLSSKLKSTSKHCNLLCRSIHIEKKLESLGITLFKKVIPRGNYVPFVKVDNVIYIAGHLPIKENNELVVGRLGENMNVDEGKHAARLAGIQLISTMKLAVGDLDKIKRIVKIFGVVNSTNDFQKQADVMNGCSDLFGDVFGEKGIHSRTSIGTSVLPLGIPIEIEAIIEVEE